MAKVDKGESNHGSASNDELDVASCAGGSTVELAARPSQIWKGVPGGEAGFTFSLEVEAAIIECTACGHALCDGLEAGMEASTVAYIPFIGRTVALAHSMTNEEREHFLRSRGVLPSPSAKLTSWYLPFVQALISDAEDIRKRYKSKCTNWSQLARGAVEGCGIERGMRGSIHGVSLVADEHGPHLVLEAAVDLPS